MHYLLNTNFGNNRQDHEHMLALGKAATFYDRKSKIDRLDAGDRVFLYQSGVGIVATGTADGRLVICDHEGDPDEEHHMKLLEFKLVSPALTAAQVKEITGTNHRFGRTLFSLGAEGGQKVSDFIHERSLARD
jgi:hypothetical protein